MKKLYFNQLSVNDEFMFNGNKYVKQSDRTARLVENKRLFYFTRNEVVAIIKGLEKCFNT